MIGCGARLAVVVLLGLVLLAARAVPEASAAPTLNLTEWCPPDVEKQYGASASLSGFEPFTPFSGTLSFDDVSSVSVETTTDADGAFGGGSEASAVPVDVVTLRVTYSGGELVKTLQWPCQTTTTSVRCSAARVVAGRTVSCAATVRDPPTSLQRTPKGLVRFSAGGAGIFEPASCRLAGRGPSSACRVAYRPRAAGGRVRTVVGRYLGERVHHRSAGRARVTVRPHRVGG